MREIRLSGLTRGRVMPSLLYWLFFQVYPGWEVIMSKSTHYTELGLARHKRFRNAEYSILDLQ